MNLYDCTTYFDEPMIMDIRFNVLNQYVKKFIVIESTYSHSGSKKKLNFDIGYYPKFKDKIEYIVVDSESKNLINLNSVKNIDWAKRENSVKRIAHQRNEAFQAIKEASENDFILYSDNDEIPNLKNINLDLVKEKFIIFEQKLFYYKFNLLYPRINWFGTKGMRKKNLLSISDLRNIKSKKYPFYRVDTLFSKTKHVSVKIIKNGGWHFSQLKTPEALEQKFLNDENHNEYDMLNFNIEKIRDMINRKVILYDHLAKKSSFMDKHKSEFKLKKVNLDSMPEYLIKNVEKYKTWFDLN